MVDSYDELFREGDWKEREKIKSKLVSLARRIVELARSQPVQELGRLCEDLCKLRKDAAEYGILCADELFSVAGDLSVCIEGIVGIEFYLGGEFCSGED